MSAACCAAWPPSVPPADLQASAAAALTSTLFHLASRSVMGNATAASYSARWSKRGRAMARRAM